ncbi:MAG: hypothetical protein SFV23_08095 [Planctomycetaceae bacterium]|nr:hypothetical protein [Planctomycetaceae bacterium]
MNPPFHIQARDRELLLALAQKVRLFSQRQVADYFWDGALPNARRRMKQLAQRELVARITVQARTAPPLESPLASWRPGDSAPEFGRVAYRCHERWRQRPVRPCAAWIATEQTAQLFGGVRRGGLTQPTQATHDLGVAAVWLRLRQVAPLWATAWRGEDLFAEARRGEKLPDAFLVDQAGQVVWVIEFGGGYDAERVAAFHADCADRGLPYQLW